MNLDSRVLDRTYFIGGPPRVGKSILAYALAKEIGGHVVSTDSIRDAAKKACLTKSSDLFVVNSLGQLSDEEWLKMHLQQPEQVIEYQNKESTALWPALVAFCNSFGEDRAVHVVEGVALLPSLVSKLKNRPGHVVYIGNTSKKHVENMRRYMEQFPGMDWMAAMGYDENKVKGMASFINRMSYYFKREAKKYNFPYYEISDGELDASLYRIIKKITE